MTTDILPVIFKIVNSRRSGLDIENNMVNIFGNLEYQGDIKNFTYLLMYSYAIYIYPTETFVCKSSSAARCNLTHFTLHTKY